MIRPRPPPTIRRASKALVAAVVGFIAAPGTLTLTGAVLIGSHTTPSIAVEPPTIAACAVAAALVAFALYATARTQIQ